MTFPFKVTQHRQEKVINTDSAYTFLIIYLISQNGQNDRVGKGGQNGTDFHLVICSGMASSSLGWCSVVKFGVMRSCLVWFGLLSLDLVWSGQGIYPG